MKKLFRTFFIILIVLILAATLFLFVFKDEYFDRLAADVVQANSSIIENIRQSAIPQNSNVLDATLLSNPKFKNLQNNAPSIKDVNPGNKNPFISF
jgi:uncharacterized membrane protein affecting hemolysin expression